MDNLKAKMQSELENLGFMEVCYPKFIRSLMRSEVRKSILLHLHEIYPQASYPAEIARCIGVHPMSVIGALKGTTNRYNVSNSLLTLGALTVIDDEGVSYYKLSEVGVKVAESVISTQK